MIKTLKIMHINISKMYIYRIKLSSFVNYSVEY